jgi:CubicO group peptidase (beta-lactamase class C family)
MLKLLSRYLLLVAGGLTLTFATPAQTPPIYTVDLSGRYPAADEALYRERLEQRFKVKDLETYDPTVAVTGARTWRPLPVTSRARPHTISPDALAAAQSYAAEHASSALLVWRLGRTELEAYFGGQTATGTVIARSLAKPLAALAVGRALALGKIRSLDQPVADFFPDWRNDPRRVHMRIHHLLDMTSGFPPQSFGSRPDDLMNLGYLHPHHAEIIEHDMPLITEPGSKFAYNNATYELIALLIERATGTSYQDFLGHELLTPIGARGGEIWIDRPGGTAHSACCIMIPAESWLRLGILLAQDGVWQGERLLPSGFVLRMTTGTAANTHYGLGVFLAGDYVERRNWGGPDVPAASGVLHSEPYLARDLFLFDGNGNQVLYIIPSEQLVILRTGNSPPRAHEWDNSVLPNLLLRGIERERGTSVPQAR